MTTTRESPLSAYLAKLERRTSIPPEEKSAFLSLPHATRHASNHEVIVHEGAVSNECIFLTSGFVSRQKNVDATSKQILSLSIAGDACDLQALWFQKHDDSIVAHADVSFIIVSHHDIISICERSPLLNKILWHDTLVDSAIFRDWTLNIGHRRARERILHLFLEIATRLKANGAIDGDSFEFPFKQADLASMLGMSLVHTNKSLKLLRDEGLIFVEGRTIKLPQRARAEKEASFDPTYLHIKAPPK